MTMKLAVGAGALCLLIGTIAPAYAQQHQEKKSEPQAGRQEQRQPQAKRVAPRPAAPSRTYGGAYHGGVQPNAPTHGGVHMSGVPQHQGQVRSGFLQSRAASWDRDHHSWQQRGGYNGYRIPDDRFRTYFGRDHFFRIARLPMRFVGGYPRFQYDGYWITFVDPWPEAWPATWYETDDVYLDYVDGGYYLVDRMHPEVTIAVTIAL